MVKTSGRAFLNSQTSDLAYKTPAAASTKSAPQTNLRSARVVWISTE